MARLFVALRPPLAVVDALLDAEGDVDGARWQDEEQLHLTLVFLGEVDPRAEAELDAALSRVEALPFELRLRGVGHFERKGAPSALWAGVAPSEPLDRLQRRVVGACRSAGCAVQKRRFQPHVTLARLNRGSGPIARWLGERSMLAAPAWPVERFTLFESTLSPEGARYEALAHYPLC